MGAVASANTLLSQRKLEDKILLIKKIGMCLLTVILIFMVFGGPITSANATISKRGSFSNAVYKTDDGTEYKAEDCISVVGSLALELAYDAYGGLNGPFQNLLKINIHSTWWTSLTEVYDVFSTYGLALALLWCLLDLLDKASSGHITGEFVLQLGIKLTIAAVVITSGGTVAQGLVDFSNSIATQVLDKVSSTGSSAGLDALFINVWNQVKTGNFLVCFPVIISLIFPALCMKICTVLMYVLLAGRLIEVGVRYILFPIGASDVFTHGLASPGFRYIKRFVGACLQGIAMYLVVFIGMALMANADDVVGIANDSLAGTVMEALFPIIVMFSVIGGMLKVSQILNDLAG